MDDPITNAYESAVLAAQEIYKRKHGHYHPDPHALLRALEFCGGVLSHGGLEGEEWHDREMWEAAERAFYEELKRRRG